MSKKLSGSYQQEKQRRKNMKYISDIENNFTDEINALKDMSEKELDLSDIPEIDFDKLKKPIIGKFYRPLKKPISIRMDADVLEWFKSYKHYQKIINTICRNYMQKHQERK
ncbi:MAG: BrnA antitoxin family protein [Candidatus Nitrosocosmicus sp.]|nr:BrnA antitoxin family protein [Candidatus Nitrosocosmicus sp.]